MVDTIVGVTIPLHNEIVFFIARHEESRLVFNFLKNEMGLTEMSVLFRELGNLPFLSAWEKSIDLLQKPGETKLELSFYDFVKGQRVIDYIVSRVRFDISQGNTTLFRGKLQLSESTVNKIKRYIQLIQNITNAVIW